MKVQPSVWPTVFLMILLVTSLSRIVAADIQTVRIACEDKASPPIILGFGENIPSTDPGVAIDVLNNIAKELNIRITYSRFPWKRALKELQENTIDAVFFASYNESRLEYGVYPMKDGKIDTSKHFIALSYVLYTLKDSPLQWDGKRFIGLTGSIGAPLGYSIVDDLEKMGVPVDLSPERRHDFLKLTRGRVQGVAAQDMLADPYLFFNPDIAQQVKKVLPPITTKYYYLLLSKGFVEAHPQLAQQIWGKIEEKRENGTIDGLIKQYYPFYPEE